MNGAKLQNVSEQEIVENDIISFAITPSQHNKTNRMHFVYRLCKTETVELDSGDDSDILEINDVPVVTVTINDDDNLLEASEADQLSQNLHDDTGNFEQATDIPEVILTEINIYNPSLPNYEESTKELTTQQSLVESTENSHASAANETSGHSEPEKRVTRQSTASKLSKIVQTKRNLGHLNKQTAKLIEALPILKRRRGRQRKSLSKHRGAQRNSVMNKSNLKKSTTGEDQVLDTIAGAHEAAVLEEVVSSLEPEIVETVQVSDALAPQESLASKILERFQTETELRHWNKRRTQLIEPLPMLRRRRGRPRKNYEEINSEEEGGNSEVE